MSFSIRRSRSAALFGASALVLALAACDGDDTTDPDTEDATEPGDDDAGSDPGVASDPEGALKDAVAAMADWDGISLEMSFQADDTARAAILAESPEDEEFMDMFLNSSVSMTATGDEESGAMQMGVTVDGTDVFEMYVAAEGEDVTAFALRVDVPSIMDMVDDPQAQAEFDAALSQAGMFGLQDAADALAAGEWISITGVNELASMAEGFATDEPQSEVDEEQAEAAAEALADRTEQLIDADVSVTHVGDDAIGDRLRLVAPGPALESYLEDVVDILATNDLLEGLSSQELQQELDQVQAEDITLDVWISGGEVRQAAIDLAQLDDADLEGEFLLTVALSPHDGTLSAPSASTTIDLMSVFGQMMGGMDGMGFGDAGGFDDDGFGDDGFDDDGFDDGFEDDAAGDYEMSDAEILMMLDAFECVTEEEIEGFAFVVPELADAAEEAIAQGRLSYC